MAIKVPSCTLYILYLFPLCLLLFHVSMIPLLSPPTPALAKAGAAPGTTEGVEPELSKSLLFSARFRRSQASHLLDCGLWALCETVGGVAQTVGSGLWRAKSSFSSGPKLPFKPLKPLEPCQWFCHTGRLKPLKPLEPCQWFCHTGRLKPLKPLEPCQWFCHTGGWRRSKTSRLLDCGPWALCAGRWRRSKTSHLLDCGLWALCETVGGVAQTVGSGLWRAKSFFLVARNCPSNPSNP